MQQHMLSGESHDETKTGQERVEHNKLRPAQKEAASYFALLCLFLIS